MQGNLIHIDFGFLLGTSPGGNIGFEKAAFKLSKEMFTLLGGKIDAPAFQEFLDLTVEAFLCVRKYWSQICSLVECMSDSGLPCFLPDTLVNLKKRFTPDLCEMQAAKGMYDRVGSLWGDVRCSRSTRKKSLRRSCTTVFKCFKMVFTPMRGNNPVCYETRRNLK